VRLINFELHILIQQNEISPQLQICINLSFLHKYCIIKTLASQVSDTPSRCRANLPTSQLVNWSTHRQWSQLKLFTVQVCVIHSASWLHCWRLDQLASWLNGKSTFPVSELVCRQLGMSVTCSWSVKTILIMV